MESVENTIKKYALQNAINYNGKANAGAVIGKIFAERPELKGDKDVLAKVQTIVKEVNSMKNQKEALEKLAPELLEKKKVIEVRELPELKNAEKGIVVRFAPNPNGPMSFGQSRVAYGNWFFVQKYKGKYLLRFDDTDPRTKVPMKEAYKLFQEDLNWLGIKVDQVIIQSERFDIYYKYAEQLIKMDGAYVCTCKAEEKSKGLANKEVCTCRNLTNDEQIKRWNKMFKDFKEGEAVLRIKTDLEDKNPAVRDWVAFRIIEEENNQHPLNKTARVWPMLNFSSACDDHEFKVTHILRGIDLAISDDRQKFIYKYLSWGAYPETIYVGRLNVGGVQSTSEAKELVKEGKLSGWDDPRLATLMSLRRRGFQAEAIRKYMWEIGINKNAIEVSMDTLAAFNKELIDKTANRYFFIEKPKKIKIKDNIVKQAELFLHPEDHNRGTRKFILTDEFYIQDEIKKNKHYRLMGALDFMNGRFIQIEKGKDSKLIHWLPVDAKNIVVSILMEDNSVKKGLAEENVKNIKEGEIIQFERFGFCILDNKKEMRFVFCHR